LVFEMPLRSLPSVTRQAGRVLEDVARIF